MSSSAAISPRLFCKDLPHGGSKHHHCAFLLTSEQMLTYSVTVVSTCSPHHDSYEPHYFRKNSPDPHFVRGCYFIVFPGLEEQSSPKPGVASSCPIPRRVAAVLFSGCLDNIYLAALAKICRAKRRLQGCRTNFCILLDAILLCHDVASGSESLGRTSRCSASNCRRSVLSQCDYGGVLPDVDGNRLLALPEGNSRRALNKPPAQKLKRSDDLTRRR